MLHEQRSGRSCAALAPSHSCTRHPIGPSRYPGAFPRAGTRSQAGALRAAPVTGVHVCLASTLSHNAATHLPEAHVQVAARAHGPRNGLGVKRRHQAMLLRDCVDDLIAHLHVVCTLRAGDPLAGLQACARGPVPPAAAVAQTCSEQACKVQTEDWTAHAVRRPKSCCKQAVHCMLAPGSKQEVQVERFEYRAARFCW